ncbi:MAG: hypothetical protein ACI4MP_04295 [Candidatus Ventricola sp.]
MKRGGALFLVICICLCAACAAQAEYSPGCLMEPPQEVRDHIARQFSAYTLEDYCEIYDTPDGDYGFALLTAGDERVLLGYHGKDGKMTYWLKNHGAVMQGSEEAWFDAVPQGETRYTADGTPYLTDGLSFSVTRLDDAGEMYLKSVAYHWEDGGFKLTWYKDWDEFYGYVDVGDGVLHFSNRLEGWDFGKVYGTVQRDLRYVSYDALPKTIEEARKKLTQEPDIPKGGLLEARRVRFTGGQKYPVYTGPGEKYVRSGNGKGQVSTNDWIQVFGRVGDYIMIQYDISADHYRIGWIDASAMPKGESAGWLTFGQGVQTLKRGCTLTDDPLNSGAPLCELHAGDQVINLCNLGYDWVYVQVSQSNGLYCGFVPSWVLEE